MIYCWVLLVWILSFTAFQRWFLYGLKVIITLCRAETICGKVHFTIRIIKPFSFPNNLSLGLPCLNPAFPLFQRWFLCGLKVIMPKMSSPLEHTKNMLPSDKYQTRLVSWQLLSSWHQLIHVPDIHPLGSFYYVI